MRVPWEWSCEMVAAMVSAAVAAEMRRPRSVLVIGAGSGAPLIVPKKICGPTALTVNDRVTSVAAA